ncbi:unnamed protein product [Eruca vesicaria subsp. sativa]|uniref:Uncharacterized protein n=1 Tax=Eruca vesicaria subsp. sativa TaxID=29727 RepID=A0ABC8LIJ2_ERUVS|nr:unnamed protein product [Eruca vesicaria subsp. sativa]
MFKYKERLNKMQVLPLHVVLLWSNSCSVWHRWRSKVDSTGHAEMVGALECLISIEIEAGTFKAYRLVVFSCQWRSRQFMKGRDGVFFSYKLEGKLVLVDGSIDRLLFS